MTQGKLRRKMTCFRPLTLVSHEEKILEKFPPTWNSSKLLVNRAVGVENDSQFRKLMDSSKFMWFKSKIRKCPQAWVILMSTTGNYGHTFLCKKLRIHPKLWDIRSRTIKPKWFRLPFTECNPINVLLPVLSVPSPSITQKVFLWLLFLNSMFLNSMLCSWIQLVSSE